MKSLTYLNANGLRDISLNILESDSQVNLIHMENVVGTLVKYGGSARSEPYLAKRWEVSPDGLKWKFELRPGLSFEDGQTIDSTTYVRGLKKLLRLYLKTNSPPDFNRLVGWKKFAEGSDEIQGILTPSPHIVEFHFEDRPSGLLEYLAMPYYGALSEKDFNSNGAWVDPERITSSGAYAVVNFSTRGTVLLKKRIDFPLNPPEAPEEVEIRQVDWNQLDPKHPERTIVEKVLSVDDRQPVGYTQVLGTPGILTAIDLSPKLVSRWKDVSQRTKFRKAVRKAQEGKKIQIEGSIPTLSFFASREATKHRDESDGGLEQTADTSQKHINIFIPSSFDRYEKDYTEGVLTEALQLLGLHPKFIVLSKEEKNWRQRVYFSSEFDVRVKRVSIGGAIDPFVVEMMFCSKMGVSFPDPSGRICKITQHYKDRPQEEQLGPYAEEFERIVYEDAAVIPLFHSGLAWLFSNDLDLSQVAPTMMVPRFDLMRLK